MTKKKHKPPILLHFNIEKKIRITLNAREQPTLDFMMMDAVSIYLHLYDSNMLQSFTF